ncbi:hypothetical protein PR048_027996 [Dryococelus australis]|uniref:Uncharacterized protein n=1 Tax=Dryococelus australis TaxID=614101 RepID=A0ABQ9GI30_9NEOP|nr:hypothetical protein PR048_027996 [Dryococelus australis]
MRVIKVSMEKHRNEREGETGDVNFHMWLILSYDSPALVRSQRLIWTSVAEVGPSVLSASSWYILLDLPQIQKRDCFRCSTKIENCLPRWNEGEGKCEFPIKPAYQRHRPHDIHMRRYGSGPIARRVRFGISGRIWPESALSCSRSHDVIMTSERTLTGRLNPVRPEPFAFISSSSRRIWRMLSTIASSAADEYDTATAEVLKVLVQYSSSRGSVLHVTAMKSEFQQLAGGTDIKMPDPPSSAFDLGIEPYWQKCSSMLGHGDWLCAARRLVVRSQEIGPVSLLESYKSEPVSIPGQVTPGLSHVVIVPYDAAGQWVFSGISRFPAFAFRRCSILTSSQPHRLPRARC